MTPAEPTENVDITGEASTLLEGKAKKKGLLGNKVETVPPYGVVTSMVIGNELWNEAAQWVITLQFTLNH